MDESDLSILVLTLDGKDGMESNWLLYFQYPKIHGMQYKNAQICICIHSSSCHNEASEKTKIITTKIRKTQTVILMAVNAP